MEAVAARRCMAEAMAFRIVHTSVIQSIVHKDLKLILKKSSNYHHLEAGEVSRETSQQTSGF